jgi:Endonuclease/Exonuclease/phosphatase family
MTLSINDKRTTETGNFVHSPFSQPTQETPIIALAQKNMPCAFPTLTSFNWDTVLSPQNFPRSLEDGHQLVTRAVKQLGMGIQPLREIPHEKRTFENTVKAYHDAMIKFDAVERLIRSERLIDDKTEGKADLLAGCIQEKEKVFSDSSTLEMFISFAEKTHQENLLSPWEWESLKGIIHSIEEKHLSTAMKEKFKQIKQIMQQKAGVAYAYLPGQCDSKILQAEKRELTFLTANLCIMPEANSMIYGGLLPYPVRIDAIAEELKHLNPDVMFLQEVYDVGALAELRTRLAPLYAHFYGNVPARLAGFSHESLFSSSGLAVISKFKLENVRFEPYTIMTHDDKPSGFDRLKVFGFDRNYGLFHCDVMNGQKVLAHFASTHENPFYADIRAKQTLQIIESFKSQALEHSQIPAILCGDLNIERGDLNEGGEQLIKEHFVDHYQGDGPTWYDFGNHWTRLWHKENAEKFLNPNPLPWTVDRSLLWAPWANNHPSFGMQIKRIPLHLLEQPELALTDHHGLLTRFTF